MTYFSVDMLAYTNDDHEWMYFLSTVTLPFAKILNELKKIYLFIVKGESQRIDSFYGWVGEWMGGQTDGWSGLMDGSGVSLEASYYRSVVYRPPTLPLAAAY